MQMKLKRVLVAATLTGTVTFGQSCYVPCNDRAFSFERRTRLENFENRGRKINDMMDALNDECPQIRKLAEDSLVALGKDAIPALLARLRSRGRDTKIIISVLGKIGDERAISPLVETMDFCLNGPGICRPEEPLSALRGIGKPAVQNLAVFAMHENKTVRMHSIRLLAQMKEFEVLIPALAKALNQEDTAADAADEIRNIIVRERMEPANKSLIYDWSAVVSGLCIALKKYRLKEDRFTGALAEIGTGAFPAFVSLLEDGDWWMRTRAAKAIDMGIGANPDADWKSLAPALSCAWAKETNWPLKKYMADPLKKIGRKAIPAFIEMLRKNSNSDEKFVFDAAEILGELGGKYSMVDLIKDGDAMVRKVAVLALKDVGDGSSIPLLLEKSWRDPDADVKRFANYAMQKIEKRESGKK